MTSQTSLTPMQTFEEKVKGKLKETIADMLPDEVLASLVQRAVEEQFFKERERVDGYNRVTERRPSWFVEEVAKMAEPILRNHISEAFAARKDEIDKAVADFVSSQNLALLMTAAMSQSMASKIMQEGERIADRIRRNY